MSKGKPLQKSKKQAKKEKALKRAKSLRALGYKIDKNGNVVTDEWNSSTFHNASCDCDTCFLPGYMWLEKKATMESSGDTKGTQRKHSTVFHVDKYGKRVESAGHKDHSESECSKSSTTYCGLDKMMQSYIDDVCSVRNPEGYARYKTFRNERVKKIIFSDKVSTKKSQTTINSIYSEYLLTYKNRQAEVVQKRKDREIRIQQSKSQVKHTSWLDQLDHVNYQLFG